MTGFTFRIIFRYAVRFRSRVMLVLLLSIFTNVFTQTSFLSRNISLDFHSGSLEVALQEIARSADFRFSYDADLIPGKKQVHVKTQNTPVKKILDELLGKEIQPREVGNHVILVRSRAMAKEKQPFPDIVVTGTIRDKTNRLPLADATIYETENKRAAISAKDGSYKLIIPTGKKVRGLSFTKSGYADSVIFIRQQVQQHVNVLLNPLEGGLTRAITLPGTLIISSTDSMGLVQWLVPRESMINAQNLEVRTSRTFQASVIPYIGTNWRITGSITNRLSLNLLAGYTGGLKGVEIGGLLNITRNQVQGVQIGGLGNVVGGYGKGWQVGGLFNFDLGKFDGVQIGGLFNYVPDTITGVQIGGLTNIITGQIKGVQVAGLANIVTHNSDGYQIAGLLNLTLMDVKKAQIGGLVNYGRNMDGVQIAGLVNIARRHNSGVQIAGLLNYATMVYGIQLGIINVSNTVVRGVPIGLFSYVQEGYHLFELSGNEIFYGNVGFKSGTRSLYNLVQFGMGSDFKLQGSYGIGTIFTLKKKLSMNIDASAGFVYHPTDTIYHGFLLKLNPALEFRFAKHFAIFGGPAYNFFLFPKGKPSATSRGLSYYDFYFESTENASIQMWIGGVLGIRL